MPEGLSPAEVSKEIAEHKKHTETEAEAERSDRWLSILEALLLSLVAVFAAYSGYAAAKWGTESSVTLAKASAERTKANRADLEAIVTRTADSASFNAWFTAFTAGNANAERLAAKRCFHLAEELRLAHDDAVDACDMADFKKFAPMNGRRDRCHLIE